MAKGSAMGLWRGKKGSSVFYYLRNSNNREKQGIREYQPVVANPQTSAQLDQRMFITPAQNIYRQLADIIRRSWQGKEYGGKGTQEFFKGALRHDTTRPVGIPWLNKGDQRAVPGVYQISNGTIQEVFINEINEGGFVTSLYVGDAPGSTWGEYSEKLISNNDIKQGDQVTIVTCTSNKGTSSDQATAAYTWYIASVYVNTDDNTPVSDVLPLPVVLGNVAGFIAGDTSEGGTTQNLAAAAVIVSRLGNTGTYQRSPSTIAVNMELMAYWYTANRHDLARTSYILGTGGTRSGNWIVDEGGGDAPTTREMVDGTYAINGLTGDLSTLNGTLVKVKRYSDDNSLAQVYISADEEYTGALVRDASGYPVVSPPAAGPQRAITPDDQPELAGLTRIVYVP